MGKAEFCKAMMDDRHRSYNCRGWSLMARAIDNLSFTAFEKMLQHDPVTFIEKVKVSDRQAAKDVAKAWYQLSDENVDEFLRLQRLHAPVRPLATRTVALELRAWFISGMGAEATAP